MKSKSIRITICIFLFFLICAVWYVAKQNNNVFAFSCNIRQAITSFNDDRIVEKDDAIYFENRKIRSLYDPHYVDERVRGYYYYDSHGKVDLSIVRDDGKLHIQNITGDKNNETSDAIENARRNKKSKYGIIIHKKNMVPDSIKEWVDSIPTSDNTLHIVGHNGRIFGYCQNSNGFGYSYENGGEMYTLSIFVNPYDDNREDYILFSIPYKEYTYVQLDNWTDTSLAFNS